MELTQQPAARNRRILFVFSYLVVWLLMAIFMGALLGSNLPRYRTLTLDGVKTFGSVIAVEPQQHQAVRYTYLVNGETYTAVGGVGDGNPPFESLSSGDSVLLYYVPSNPSLSELGEPDSRLKNELISVLIAILIFPTILAWSLVSRWKRFSK
jgi:Protein of unknown function (DUF3592)